MKLVLLAKNRRLERNIRQKDLSAQSGVSVTTIAKIEAGTPTVEMRSYMLVLWYLGLLDEVFQDVPMTSPASFATEHRVRLKQVTEADF